MADEQSVEQFNGQPRLPKFAIPKRYDINLKPDLVACKFAGFVQVSIDVVADTRFLVLNAADLAIDKESVWFRNQDSSEEFHPSEIVVVEEDGILVFRFDEVLPLGDGILGIRFEGTLNDQMKGFYRSTYEHNGEKKNMAATQFESTDARRCFSVLGRTGF